MEKKYKYIYIYQILLLMVQNLFRGSLQPISKADTQHLVPRIGHKNPIFFGRGSGGHLRTTSLRQKAPLGL